MADENNASTTPVTPATDDGDQQGSTVMTTPVTAAADEDSQTTDQGDAGATPDNPDAEGSDTPGDTGEGDQTSTDAYADFAIPEGLTLDESLLAEATPVFKELGLNQEQAQKLVDIYAKQVEASFQKQVDDFNQVSDGWLNQAKVDQEFGGDMFDENIKLARNAIDKLGTPELQKLMDEYKIGNNPELIRFMVRVGKTLKEDVPGTSGSQVAEKTDRVQRMYPNN
jgi:hypothetical protein